MVFHKFVPPLNSRPKSTQRNWMHCIHDLKNTEFSIFKSGDQSDWSYGKFISESVSLRISSLRRQLCRSIARNASYLSMKQEKKLCGDVLDHSLWKRFSANISCIHPLSHCFYGLFALRFIQSFDQDTFPWLFLPREQTAGVSLSERFGNTTCEPHPKGKAVIRVKE